MRLRRVIAVSAGAVTMLAALGIGGAGGVLLWANATQRDAAGYFTTPTEEFRSPGVALISTVNFEMRPEVNSWLRIEPLGTVRVRARLDGERVFLGVASTQDVRRYFAGSSYSTVTSVSVLPFRAHYEDVTGSRKPPAPATQAFWAASRSGPGSQQLTGRPSNGQWSLVVMGADASAGLLAHVSVGTNTGLVLPLGVLLVLLGVLLLGLGVLLVTRGTATKRRPPGADDTLAPGGTGWASGAYPVRVEGRLEPGLSRGLWLVKWLLVVPHIVVLAFLWLGVLALSVVAWFSILLSGRYPRDIFNFVVGVMRWSWRVSFYATSAIGTDRYPPFSLSSDPTYPADFDVAYPERLSRGLVLIKSWLLVIPQYIVVGIFTGGGAMFGSHWPQQLWFLSGGVVGILVVAAGVTLLFTGEYPEALFNVVMGMDRWSARVGAYVLLLRDEYPPFRFDAGGQDPASREQAGEDPDSAPSASRDDAG